MVTKIKKSIDNSKRKGDFKKRDKMRIEKKQRKSTAESMEFVDKREMIKAKKRNNKPAKKPVKESDEDEEMDDAELEKELAKDLEEDKEFKNPDLLDETVFNKFATGELDLPEDEADQGLSDDEADEAAAAEDSELEAYYEELGIDVTEMH